VAAPTATVLRDGEWIEIPRRDVVPGDLVRLGAGDRVPADGRLLEARALHVQQAALTGESLPTEKHSGGDVRSAAHAARGPEPRLPRHLGGERYGGDAGGGDRSGDGLRRRRCAIGSWGGLLGRPPPEGLHVGHPP
jgi:magnesium-transporting ATPase (P-type)